MCLVSVEAITWANKQRVGSSGAKLVLLALANYADADGLCWPSYRALAIVTEMSADSISRHIATLEARAVVEREARFDKTGRRTTNAVRLLLEAGGTPAICGVPTPAEAGGTPPQKQGVRTPQKQGDHILNPHLEPSEEPTPQAPEGAEVGNSQIDGEGAEGAAIDTQFDVFWSTFGADPAASRSTALRRWAKLSGLERAEALTWLPRYLDHCRANKRKLVDPSTYLHEERWKPFMQLAATPAPEPAKPTESDPVTRAVLWATSTSVSTSEWPFVEEGSDAWKAWREAFVTAGYRNRWTAGRRPFVLVGGTWVKSDVPGRNFPTRYPASREGSTDPPDVPSAEEIEQHLGG